MVGGNLSCEKAQSNFRLKLALGGTIQGTRGAGSEHSLQLTGEAGRNTAKFLSPELETKIPCDDLAQENRGTTELQMF